MSYNLKQRIKTKILSSFLALCVVFTSFVVTPVTAQAANDYGLATEIQDGVILHCFNWKYNDIKAELPNIAKAGFTSVQTSPAQVGVSSGKWYWLYQPLGFYAGTNDLGTVDELRSLCQEADKYGIKVIVDVIANHLAGDHTNIQSDLKDSQYWHQPDFPATDWKNRYHVTYGNIGMPDINTEHSYVQQCVANYINSLKDLGVDGIRWDTTKHISLPSEGSNFWPAVTSQGLYHYGEILKGPDDRDTGNEGLMKEYTNYLTVTDSVYGTTLRNAFNSGTAPTAFGNWAARGISNDKLIYWGESHDTWSNNQEGDYSNGMSQNVIDRAYAVAASRNDITALYFSRPSSTYKETIYAGQKGSTHFTSAEVAAVNHFHNAMIGQPDYYTTGNNCAVVCRQKGAVIVAGSGGNFSVTVPNGGSTTEPGTYTDEITGSTWTVTEDTISGYIGSTGIAVIYNGKIDVTYGNVYYDNTNNWDTVYAYYWSDSDKGMTTWPGEKMTKGSDGTYSVKIRSDADYIIFGNGNDSNTDDIALNGFDMIYKDGTWSKYTPIVTKESIYYKNTDNWSNVYAYYWSDSNEAMTTWPGVQMSNVKDNEYTAEIPSDAQYIIFSNGSGTQTDDLTLEGFDKIYINGSWSDYDGGGEVTKINVYYKNTNNWSNVYAYYWSDSNKAMTTWPGVQMSNDSGNVYKVEIPSDANYIIFSNGSGTQTDDLTLAGADKVYDNGSWADYNGGGEDPVEGNIFYQNTNNWSEVYAYYWSDSDTKMTTWPGEKMTGSDSGVYGIEVPEDAEYIIFNNGNGTQTGDLTIEGFNMIYNNGSWAKYN